MSIVEIRDHALWIKHIHGNETLKEKLLGLQAGELIQLEVDGQVGTWKKMDDGKDGRPSFGIKALAKAREHWHSLQVSRGEMVSIKESCLCCDKNMSKDGSKICPVCSHVFKGSGWDGIDSHWRAHHEDIKPYEIFWKSLCQSHKG